MPCTTRIWMEVFPHTERKKNSIPGKKVTFQEGLVMEKPARMMRVNFSTILASTYYSTSLLEMSLIRD